MRRAEMKLKDIIDSSIVVSGVRLGIVAWGRAKVLIRHAFACSFTYKAVRWSGLKLNASLKKSFLGRMTEPRDGPLRDILGGSLAFAWLNNKARTPFSILRSVSGDSFFAKKIISSFKGIASNPVKAAGIFLLISGSVNTILSIVTGPKMGLVGALLRAAWIGLGLICTFCPDGYRPVARDSFLLRFIKEFP